MKEKKDLKLINIYIRIHNKKVLTMDDLAYLAQHNPECFKKTCDNLIYKMPEAKKLVAPPKENPISEEKQHPAEDTRRNLFEATAEEKLQAKRQIMQFFESMEKIESQEMGSLQNIDVTKVKELVGDLFMENLFPHSGLQGYFDMHEEESAHTFNVRV